MKSRFLAALLTAGLFWSCSVREDPDANFTKYFDPVEEEYEDICIAMGNAVWIDFTDGDPGPRVEAHQRFYQFFNNDSLRSQVKYWYENRDELSDPILQRKISIWNRMMTGASVNYSDEIYELRSRIESGLSRPDEERDNDLLEKEALELMRARNEKAGELGFPSYADMILDITGIGSEWFDGFISQVDSITLEPYELLVAELKEEKGLSAAGFSDISFMIREYYSNSTKPDIENEEKGDLLRSWLGDIGIRLEDLPVRSEIRSTLPVGIGGFGNAIEIPGDFRFVVQPFLSFRDWVHEMGHGLQWMHTTVPSPVLEGYEWITGSASDAYMEGMGETMAKFTSHPLWLERYAGLTESDYKQMSDVLRKYSPAWYRMLLVNSTVEIEIYRNLDRPPEDVRNTLYKNYLLLDNPPEWDLELATQLYVSYPVYEHNYLLADIISWQIHRNLRDKFGDEYVFDPGVTEYLKMYCWESGEIHDWQERLRSATGRDLDTISFFRSIFGENAG